MTPEEIAAMQADLKKSQEEVAKLKSDAEAEKKRLEEKNKLAPKDEDDLLQKAKKEEEEKKKAAAGDKTLESALEFNMKVGEFVKGNADILPTDFAKVVELANKESYDTPKQKANAIRSGLIQSYFSVQAHVDMLTENQKKNLADFMKLTKTGKEETSHSVYENVFEPSFEMLKHLKKAEDKAKTKASQGTNTSSYKDKLMKGSTDKYFGRQKQ